MKKGQPLLKRPNAKRWQGHSLSLSTPEGSPDPSLWTGSVQEYTSKMSDTAEELLKRPLYGKKTSPVGLASLTMYSVFNLPQELLLTLQLKDPTVLPPPLNNILHFSESASGTDPETLSGETKPSTTCQLCGTSFPNVQQQRLHVKTDWHNYNLKQKIRGAQSVSENDFEKLVDDLDESISGSGSESSQSEADGEGAKESTLSALLKKQANLGRPRTQEESMSKKQNRGPDRPPLVWFSTPLIPNNTSLGIYRAVFTNSELEQPDLVDVVRKKQLRPVPGKPLPAHYPNGAPPPSTMTSPQIFLCMIGGGHFAGMIVSLAPRLGKQTIGIEQRQAAVIAHKTFHRYTTRRKQGGAQSANDSAKGAAHSAGSSLRRYNEVALEQEIRALLAEWRDLIAASQLIFVRATGSSNRRILFGPYQDQVLRQNDPRNRTFPFSTRRATQAELMRAFVEVTRVKVSYVDEVALAEAAATAAQSEVDRAVSQANAPILEAKAKPSKEEEVARLHTTQLQALVRRSKVPALLSYLVTNSLSPDFLFDPPTTQANHHAPTPLHLASSINSPAVVLALLTKAGVDPSVVNKDGKTAFDLAGERGTRDAFRVARSELGEGKWNWNSAHIPAPLSKAEADKREEWERAEACKAELERRKAEEDRLRNEVRVVDNGLKKAGRGLVAVEKTAEERREEDGRGMTPQMRMMVERERRARAAEARLGRR